MPPTRAFARCAAAATPSAITRRCGVNRAWILQVSRLESVVQPRAPPTRIVPSKTLSIQGIQIPLERMIREGGKPSVLLSFGRSEYEGVLQLAAGLTAISVPATRTV